MAVGRECFHPQTDHGRRCTKSFFGNGRSAVIDAGGHIQRFGVVGVVGVPLSSLFVLQKVPLVLPDQAFVKPYMWMSLWEDSSVQRDEACMHEPLNGSCLGGGEKEGGEEGLGGERERGQN